MSSSAVQPPLGDNAPMDGRAREMLDAIDGYNQVMVRAEAARLAAIVEFLLAYRVLGDYTGPGTERWVQFGHDGTPVIGEFGILELAPILGITPDAAWSLATRALDVKFRLPMVWTAVMSGAVAVSKALKLAELTARLPKEQAGTIDEWVAVQAAVQPFGRVCSDVERWVLALDPQAADKAQTRQLSRRVVVGPVEDGDCDVFAQLSARDAIDLDAAVSAIADTLPADPTQARDRDHRRAAAVGVLARQTFGQDPLPTHTLVVHVNATDPALPSLSDHTVDGVAAVERWGTLLTTQLPQFLTGSKVIVRPVLDPAGLGSIDGHDPSEAMRLALQARNPVDVFPFGSKPAWLCDIDHTREYVPGCPGQTHLANLGPLSRRAHRAKTHAGWILTQIHPGTFVWNSPLGYRYLVTPKGSVRLNPRSPDEARVDNTLVYAQTTPGPLSSGGHPVIRRPDPPAPPPAAPAKPHVDDTPPPF